MDLRVENYNLCGFVWVYVCKYSHVTADYKCGSTGLQYTIQKLWACYIENNQKFHDTKLNQLGN